MSARDELAAMLRPLTSRMCVSHCWVKGKNGPRHIDEPFTEVKLSEHVMRGQAYGLCPIAPGESTTRVACLDLDSHRGEVPFETVRHAAEAIAVSLELEGHSPHLFRSSGGQGIHIYLLWDAPQDAYSVREMLRLTLEACGYRPGTKGVADGEIEVFPKQDEVPSDLFGSMFVLPFSGRSEPLEPFEGFRPSGPVPVARRPPTKERSDAADSPDLARIRSALDAIPNEHPKELSYDDWRNIIFGIHYATDGSAEGLALAHGFSARSSKYDGDFLNGRVWPYVRSERGGAVVTQRSLFARAGEHGWQDPAVADDFGVVDTGIHQSTTVGDSKQRFTFVPAAVFTAGKAPGWIVKGVVPRADLVVVYGESGSGKTFLALDIIGAVARGEPWRGLRTQKLRVGYIVAEGAAGFRNRLKAYSGHHGVALEALDIVVLGDAPNFMEKADIVDLVAGIRAAGPMGLIVVDTLAQVTPGSNENAGEDMGRVIGHCRTIHKVTGATVVLIHHSGKDASRGARGWSGLRAAADAEIEITRADDDRVATITKLKDGDDGAEFGFKLAIVPVDMDEDGDVVSSCVVEHGDAAPRVERLKPIKGDVQVIAYQTITDLQGAAGAPFLAEVLLEIEKKLTGGREKFRAGRAFEGLEAAGRIHVADGRVHLGRK